MEWMGERFSDIVNRSKDQIALYANEILADDDEVDETGQGSSTSASKTGEELSLAKIQIRTLEQNCIDYLEEVETWQKEAIRLKELLEESEKNDKLTQRILEEKNAELERLSTELLCCQKKLEGQEEPEGVADVAACAPSLNEFGHRVVSHVKDTDGEEDSLEAEDEREGRIVLVDASVQASSAKECIDAAINTDIKELVTLEMLEEDKVHQDAYFNELKEQCSSYQTELYGLREELMALQIEVDEQETLGGELCEETLHILHSSFLLDGKPSLQSNKFRQSSLDSTTEGLRLIVCAIKQLSSVWKAIVDRKNSLERAVSKLSRGAPDSATTIIQHDESSINEARVKGQDSNEESSKPFENENSPSKRPHFHSPVDCYIPQVDSFVLETIIEEERGEEESGKEEEACSFGDDQPSQVAFIHKPKPPPQKTSTHCQTDSNEQDAQMLRMLSEKAEKDKEVWSEKESAWMAKVEEREYKICKLQSEVQRLQSHLMEMEEQSTTELIAGERKMQEMSDKIRTLEEQMSSALDERQIEAVEEEMRKMTVERELMKKQQMEMENQIDSLNMQLQDLNFVLEQFQNEKEMAINEAKMEFKQELRIIEERYDGVCKELEREKALLVKARSGLDAAQQLSNQIEEKNRSISKLKNEVEERMKEIGKLRAQLDDVLNNLDGKIDRYLVKNLVVGYFSTPLDKRNEVLRVLATVLDFNREDRQKSGLESSAMWPFSRFSIRSGTSSSQIEGQSFSEAFARFLESESQPRGKSEVTPESTVARRSSSFSGRGVEPSADDGRCKGKEEEVSKDVEKVAEAEGREGDSAIGNSLILSPPPAIPITSRGLDMDVNLPVMSSAGRSSSILKDVMSQKSE